MSGMRQKIQYSLALAPKGWGEAPARGHQGTEPPMAKSAPESPACVEKLMEEVCDLSIYQFIRHLQSFGSGRRSRRSLMARRRPRVNQESFPRASLAG